jgi:MYXO-CTERM domain-containing protein
MQTRFSRRTLPVLFCAAYFAAPASAGLVARASISDMRISVVDLTPDDGEPAGFNLGVYSVNLVARIETDGQSDSDSDSPAAGMPGRAEVSAPGMGAAIYTSGALGEIIAENHLAASNISLSAEGYQYWGLNLLPHSRLVIQGSMTVEAIWTPQPYAWDYFAEASAGMSFAAWGGPPPFQVGHGYRFSGNNSAQQVRETEDYTYVYENVGDSVVSVYVNGGAWVGGRASVSAVPEPGALPMLLAGIALLPAWCRRRRAALQHRREVP